MNSPGKRGAQGLTLIELLVVVSLIAILAMLSTPHLLNAHVRSKVARTKADLRTLSLGVNLYTLARPKIYIGAARLYHSQVVGDAAVIKGLTNRTDFSSEYDPTNGTISPGDIALTALGSW